MEFSSVISSCHEPVLRYKLPACCDRKMTLFLSVHNGINISAFNFVKTFMHRWHQSSKYIVFPSISVSSFSSVLLLAVNSKTLKLAFFFWTFESVLSPQNLVQSHDRSTKLSRFWNFLKNLQNTQTIPFILYSQKFFEKFQINLKRVVQKKEI